MSLPERLKYAREQSGLTLARACKKTRLRESSLSDYETGKREPKFSQLQELATAYNTSIAFLLSDKPISKATVLWCNLRE